jgi:hypothetical protein
MPGLGSLSAPLDDSTTTSTIRHHCRSKTLAFYVEFEGLFSPVTRSRLSPYNKQVLVIHTCLPLSHFGSLATFY